MISDCTSISVGELNIVKERIQEDIYLPNLQERRALNEYTLCRDRSEGCQKFGPRTLAGSRPNKTKDQNVTGRNKLSTHCVNLKFDFI